MNNLGFFYQYVRRLGVFFLLSVLLALAVTSCSIKNTISLNADDSGELFMDFSMPKPVVVALAKMQYMQQHNLTSTQSISTALALSDFQKSLKKSINLLKNQSNTVTNIHLSQFSVGHYQIRLHFYNINDFTHISCVSGPKKGAPLKGSSSDSQNNKNCYPKSLVSVTKIGQHQKMSIHLDKNILFQYLMKNPQMNYSIKGLNLETLQTASRQDFISVLDFFFQSHIPKLNDYLKTALIKLIVQFPRPIISHQGGILVQKNEIMYQFKFADLTSVDSEITVYY